MDMDRAPAKTLCPFMIRHIGPSKADRTGAGLVSLPSGNAYS